MWNTKFVLKSCATGGFYAGGNPCPRGSVNPCFFGVNIVFSIFSCAPNRCKGCYFSNVSHYLSVLRAVLSKSLYHVLIICKSGNTWVIGPRLAVDFRADGGHYFTGSYVDELFAKYQAKG